jgi:hypothetical protein
MKKGIYFLLAAGLVLGSAGIARAQTANDSATAAPETKKEVTTPVKKGALSEERKAAVLTMGQNMINRLGNALAKEQDLGTRLNSRISKLEAEGVDVTAAKAQIAEAQTSWQKAAEAVTGLQAEMDKVVAASSPKTAFVSVQKIVKTAANDIKKVHANILAIIKLLKAAQPAVSASSTVPTPAANQ